MLYCNHLTKKLTVKNNKLPDEMLSDSKNLPRVSLIIPFRHEMTKQPGLVKLLVSAANKVEQSLMIKYSVERVIPVMKKLRHLIKDVKCRKDEKTLAIFVSPLSEKIYYFTPSKALRYLPVLVKKIIKWDKNPKK